MNLNQKGLIIVASTGVVGFVSGWTACRLFDMKRKNGKKKTMKSLPVADEESDGIVTTPILFETEKEEAAPVVEDDTEGARWVFDSTRVSDEVKEILADYVAIDSDISENKKASKRPYLIDEEEYDTDEIYKKRELTLYLGDGTVTDESDDEVNNWKELVGVDALRELEAMGERVVFVRNEQSFEDFMIVACDASYGGNDDE